MTKDNVKGVFMNRGVVSAIASFLTLCITIGSGFFLLESRYAKAADMFKQQITVQETIRQATIKLQLDALGTRMQNIEDELWVLDTIPLEEKTAKDAATKSRYERRLNKLVTEERDLKRELRE